MAYVESLILSAPDQHLFDRFILMERAGVGGMGRTDRHRIRELKVSGASFPKTGHPLREGYRTLEIAAV
jgi:hypothetical protein